MKLVVWKNIYLAMISCISKNGKFVWFCLLIAGWDQIRKFVYESRHFSSTTPFDFRVIFFRKSWKKIDFKIEHFCQKFRFLVQNLDPKCQDWSKLFFIFDQNINVCQKICQYLSKLSIFDQNINFFKKSDFWSRCHYLSKNKSIFGPNVNICQSFWLLVKIIFCQKFWFLVKM